MSFLDGIAAEVMLALGSDLRDAVVQVPARTPNGRGGATITYTDVPVKALQLERTLAYRQQYSLPATQSEFLVLRHGLTIDLGTDHRIVYGGRTYNILGPVVSDPGEATWEFRAAPA